MSKLKNYYQDKNPDDWEHDMEQEVEDGNK